MPQKRSDAAQLAVTIRLPRSYLDHQYLQRLSGITPDNEQWKELWEETQAAARTEVRELALAALPPSVAAPTIHVLTYDDPASQPLWSANAFWQQLRQGDNWRHYAVVVGAVLALGISFAWRHTPRQRVTVRDSLYAHEPAHANLRPEARADDEGPSVHELAAEETASRDELVRLVKHNPDRAREVLNDWLREAG